MKISGNIFRVAVILVCFLNLCFGLSSFGDSCNRRRECVTGLRCLKGTCQCLNPDSQLYSDALGSCATKIGRRCGSDDDLLDTTTGNSSDIENSTVDLQNSNQDLPCVENAECRKLKLRKWCRCKDGYSPNGLGSKCVPVAKYGESCSESEPCEKRSGTFCIGGQCICPFGEHQYFDDVQKRCVSYASGNCSVPKISPCVNNAECVNVHLRTGFSTEEGVKKIHTKSVTQCHCVKGFSESKNRQCLGMSGTECRKDQPCNSDSFLVCVDGQCKCRNPLHEIVDEKTDQCVRLAGSSCSDKGSEVNLNGPSFPSCVENAECISNKCTCKDGYSKTIKKTCLLNYKANCEANGCNSDMGLACVDGVCECFDSNLVFDNGVNACVELSTTSGGEFSLESIIE